MGFFGFLWFSKFSMLFCWLSGEFLWRFPEVVGRSFGRIGRLVLGPLLFFPCDRCDVIVVLWWLVRLVFPGPVFVCVVGSGFSML